MNTAPSGRSARKWISLVILFLAVPGALALFRAGGNRHYYLISLLVFALVFAAFFISFENRKPGARELVVLAVLCALAVASRAVFLWLPSFKPMCAVVILAGAAMGAEAGFLVGAVSAFVSNFFFGQGPWTPWQMFAFGLAGFSAALFCRIGLVKKERVPLTVFGVILVVVLVGPLLDTCSLLTMTTAITKETAAAAYLTGLPMNLIHALAVGLFLFFFSKPLLEKLERIRVKYGMME